MYEETILEQISKKIKKKEKKIFNRQKMRRPLVFKKPVRLHNELHKELQVVWDFVSIIGRFGSTLPTGNTNIL